MSEDELERLREQRREELRARAEGDSPGNSDAGDGATDDGTAGDSGATDERGQTSGVPTEPIHVEGADQLDDLVARHDVVLVDFYADWCGPCQQLEPVVADLAAETAAVVAKVDVDAHQRLAGEYGVSGVPTLVLFADGELVERIVGAREKHQFEALIERHVA